MDYWGLQSILTDQYCYRLFLYPEWFIEKQSHLINVSPQMYVAKVITAATKHSIHLFTYWLVHSFIQSSPYSSTNPPTRQPIGRSIRPSVHHSFDQSINQLTDRSINWSSKQTNNQSIHKPGQVKLIKMNKTEWNQIIHPSTYPSIHRSTHPFLYSFTHSIIHSPWIKQKLYELN